MGVRCEGVKGATAKPPCRLRRGETLCHNKIRKHRCQTLHTLASYLEELPSRSSSRIRPGVV